MSTKMEEYILSTIVRDTGINEELIQHCNFYDIDKKIEGNSGKKLKFGNELSYSPRGNPFMQKGYIKTTEEIEKEYKKYFKSK